MAAQANVTLNAVVYTPSGVDQKGTAKWTNRTSGFGNGFSVISESVVTPSTGSVTKELFTLNIPIVATVDGACSCAGDLLRTSTVQISVWIPNSSTAAERLDLWTRIRDLVASAPFVNGVENLDPSY